MKRVISFLSAFLLCFFTFSYNISAENKPTEDTGNKKIALTFDDGPHPRYTPQILDILAEYGIKATFFEVGENVIYYSEVAKRVASEGHEIGNHTYTHPHIKNLNEEQLSEETRRCESAIKEVTGVKPKLFRPPEGVVDTAVKAWAGKNGYSVVLWSVDTRDWAGTSVDEMVKNVDSNVHSGSIILMHDYVSRRSHTIEALKKIIPLLIDKGYEFVTVSELMGK